LLIKNDCGGKREGREREKASKILSAAQSQKILYPYLNGNVIESLCMVHDLSSPISIPQFDTNIS